MCPLVRDSGLLFIYLFIFYDHRVLVEKLSVILDYGGSMGDLLGIHPSELRGMDLGSTLEGALGGPERCDGG